MIELISMPNVNNLHLNLIFRGNSEKTGQMLSISSFHTTDPEKKTGGKVLAIPSNGNISNDLIRPSLSGVSSYSAAVDRNIISNGPKADTKKMVEYQNPINP